MADPRQHSINACHTTACSRQLFRCFVFPAALKISPERMEFHYSRRCRSQPIDMDTMNVSKTVNPYNQLTRASATTIQGALSPSFTLLGRQGRGPPPTQSKTLKQPPCCSLQSRYSGCTCTCTCITTSPPAAPIYIHNIVHTRSTLQASCPLLTANSREDTCTAFTTLGSSMQQHTSFHHSNST